MKRCSYTELRLRALVDGELRERERREVLRHLNECAACREQYQQIQATSALLQDHEMEAVPAHFEASLQVRLAALRRERVTRRTFWSNLRGSRWAVPTFRPSKWVVSGLSSALALGAVCLLAFSTRGISANEVARRAEQSWAQVRNYGCVFISHGRYQGQERTFKQAQFFRRPGDFRLDTEQDYPLTTYVTKGSVVHYLPGGSWDGQDPLFIVRPRTADDGQLPFPFGVTLAGGENVSLDQLIRQLSDSRDAQLAGTEKIGDLECFRIQYYSRQPLAGTTDRFDRYELWVDTKHFIPRRMSWYRDEQNYIVTDAQFLQMNFEVLPANTFEPQVPEGACIIHGDVDPHVLAMPFQPRRTAAFDEDPIGAARAESWRRSQELGFPVFMPDYLPEGFRLVRVRRKQGQWVDAYWIRRNSERSHQIVKVVEQSAAEASFLDDVPGEELNLGTDDRPVLARLVTGKVPYAHSYLTWTLGRTRVTLFASELSRDAVRQIAQSMRRVAPPPQTVTVPPPGEASELPEPPPAIPMEPHVGEAADVKAWPPDALAPPGDPFGKPQMMPEIADDDGALREAGVAGVK